MGQTDVFVALRITLLAGLTACAGLVTTAAHLRRHADFEVLTPVIGLFFAGTCLALAWMRREPEATMALPARAERPDRQGVHIHGRKAGSAQHYALPVALRDTACAVCKSALVAPVRVCCACETAVHDMCWAYSGGCSRYACVEALGERSGERANRTAKSIST